MMRKKMKSMAVTWLAKAKAAPAVSELRAASAVPTMPTAMPSKSSMNKGQARLSKRGRVVGGRVMGWRC